MIANPNRLINEKSQYLLQHAFNPVNWFPWNDEAFEKAKLEDKPIFLSIGYSTCHWCHVMKRESFEDEEIAKLLNETFISIKVDREERPDIDGVYMKVCQMITGSGGWPLTVIMTPDKKPFFVGTYFPKKQRFNRIGLVELIPKIKEFWLSKRDEIYHNADEITKSLNQTSYIKSDLKISLSEIEKAYQQFEKRFDITNGGFGEAPKFPSPHNLIFLLRYHNLYKSDKALQMVEKTLKEMRLGGIYDHIGFGFCRYSTDRFWLVPHFEKMLYDQAMLLMAYAEAYNVNKNYFYKKTAKEIIDYLSRVLTSENGGFFCAEDADSEGEEGKFYLWTEKQIRDMLNQEYANEFIKVFNIESAGNYYDESKGIRTGKNILHLKKPLDEIAIELKYDHQKLLEIIERCRQLLFHEREKRVHPLRDEKILTDWNSLTISALVKAYAAFNLTEYLSMAIRSHEFIYKNMFLGESLYHRFKDGDIKVDGNIDDYAFFIQANVDLFEVTGNTNYLDIAISLNDKLTKNFWDEINGGYYFTSSESEELIARQKELYDGATPSGNSVQLMNLIRLQRITQDNKFTELVDQQIEFFSEQVIRYPSAYSHFLTALMMYSSPSTEIIISGSENEVKNAREKILPVYIPNRTVISISDNNKIEIFKTLPRFKIYEPNEHLKIYICSNYVCLNSVDNINDAIKELNALKNKS